jgi:hypothetical protein
LLGALAIVACSSATPAPAPVESPLAGQTLVAFDPAVAEGATNVNVFTVLKATSPYSFDTSFTLPGGGAQRTFRVELDSWTEVRSDTQEVLTGKYELAKDNASAGFLQDQAWPSTAPLTSTITVHADEFDSAKNGWFPAKLLNGTPITQQAILHLTSGVRP